MFVKICPLCGKEFNTNREKQIFCKRPHEMTCFGCKKEFMLKKPKKGQLLYTCGDYTCRGILTKHVNMEKYGVENTTQLKEIQEKMKKTTLEKYGVEHAFQSEEVKNKIKETNIERYGTETPRWHNEESRLKAEETNMNRYGASNPFGSKEIQEKIKQHNLNEYGVPWTTQAEEVKEKMKESYLRRFGVDNPAKSKEVQDKARKTSMKRYGAPHFMQSEMGIKKYESMIMKRHGVNNLSHIGITNYEDYLNLENFLMKTSLSISEIAKYFNLPRRRIRKRIIELGMQDFFDDLYVNSVKEEDFDRFLKNNEKLSHVKYIRNDRTILEGKELDFYFPNHSLAVEISPTYTHNSKVGWGNKGDGVSSTYHLNKFLGCQEKGIELITIFDWHDWDKVLEMIEIKLMGANERIYGRKTEYFEHETISNDIFNMLSNWHILSLPSNLKRKSKVSVLEFESEVVGIALWENSKKENNIVELKRMVFKPGIVVPGGPSKLLSNYIKNNPDVKTIYTFSDCDLGHGNVYNKIGFELTEESRPTLNYYNTEHEKHIKHLSLVRQGADRLLKNFPNYKHVGMGENLPSNREIIESYGFLPVYDCGYRKWTLNVK